MPVQGDSLVPQPWEGPYDFILENGLQVIFARRANSPIVELRFVMGGGFAADPDGKSGLAALAIAMFSEGLLRVDSVQVGLAGDAAAAELQGQLTADAAVLGISALSANFVDTLRIFVSALTHPEFKTEEFEELRANRLAEIADERLNSFVLPLRVLPSMLYEQGDLYARPLTGSGIEAEVATITADDLRAYFNRHLVPQGNTLVVTGSCEGAHLRAQLDEAFREWRAALPVAPIAPASDGPPNVASVRIINRPGASQTVLAAGLRTMARNSTRAEALMVADTILSGNFTSRLNLNLREEKGWTYGVRSQLLDGRGQGFWLLRTVVRSDCAAAALAEIAGEIEKLADRRLLTTEEFSRAVDYLVARMPAKYETCAQMADALAHLVIYGLPPDYLRSLADRLRRLKCDDISETWQQILASGRPQWVVVGKANELFEQLRSLIPGKIEFRDASHAELL